MSSNTNTFNGFYNEQFSKLDDSDDNLNNGEILPDIEDVISPPLISDMYKLEEFMKVSDKPYCKDHQILDSRFDVEFGYYKDDVLKYTVINVSGTAVPSIRVNVDLYDCETDERILDCGVSKNPFKAGEESTWYCMPGNGHEFKGTSWYAIITSNSTA